LLSPLEQVWGSKYFLHTCSLKTFLILFIFPHHFEKPNAIIPNFFDGANCPWGLQSSLSVCQNERWKVSRLFLQSNLCKWRFPMNTAHNINCLVMATCRPICLYVSLKTTKRGQIKNIFAFLYEWLMPLNCVYKLKSFWNWYLLFL